MEINQFFKDEDGKKGVGVTDLIIAIVAQLRENMSELVINMWDIGLIKPVKP